jgi:hypothetical protein
MDSIPRSVTTKGTLFEAVWGLNITSMNLEHGVLDIISLVVTKLAHERPNDGTKFFPSISNIDDVTYTHNHNIMLLTVASKIMRIF